MEKHVKLHKVKYGFGVVCVVDMQQRVLADAWNILETMAKNSLSAWTSIKKHKSSCKDISIKRQHMTIFLEFSIQFSCEISQKIHKQNTSNWRQIIWLPITNTIRVLRVRAYCLCNQKLKNIIKGTFSHPIFRLENFINFKCYERIKFN